MTIILIVSCLLVAFVLFLRYDVHTYKYRDLNQEQQAATESEEKAKENSKSNDQPQ